MPLKDKPGILRSRVLTLGLLALVVFVAQATWREFGKQQAIRRDIDELHKEYANLKAENDKLTRFLRYYESDEFIEREAREKMNMAKKGEHMVLITKNFNELEKDKNTKKGLQNWQLWLNYLKLGFLEKRLSGE